MANLPGWDRARLATADGRDIEAARWLVYAQSLAPTLRIDVEGRIKSLEIDKLEGDGHRLAIARQREADLSELRRLGEDQKRLRKLLELDDDDDAEAVH